MSENYSVPLYWSAPYQREILAKITAVNGNEVQFNQSLFYPGGGGQVFDTGTLVINEKEYNVIEVFKVEEQIWHKLDEAILEKTEENQDVLLKINWEKRYASMKAHSAQHLISHLIKKLFDNDTQKANFENYKIDIELSRSLTPKEAIEAIQEANELINKEIILKSIIVDGETYRREYMNQARGKKSQEETVRLIQIGEESLDLTCCGGIHVNNLSEISGIVLDTLKENKLKLLVDRGALEFANQQRILMLELENITTKKDEKMLQMIKNKLRENDLLQEGSSSLLKLLFANIEIFSEDISGKKIVFLSLPSFDRQVIQYSAKELADNVVVVILARNDILYLLSSDSDVEVDKIVKSLMEKIGTKGGGNKNFAQLFVKGTDEPLNLAKESISLYLQ